jgi:hypothetical protein
MRQIKQQDDWGCGVACVAMLAGVSYRDAKVVVHGKRGVVGTWTGDLIAALEHFDLNVGARLIPLRTRDYRQLRVNAVLKANVKKDGSWHWVVWDSDRRAIRDPHDGPEGWPSKVRRPRAISYLPIGDLEGSHFA